RWSRCSHEEERLRSSKALAKDPQENETNSVPLFERQSYLPQVVGQVVGATQQNSQSVPGWVFGIVFLGHCVVPLQPFVRGKSCKLREQCSVHFVPTFSQLSHRWKRWSCLVRTGDEDCIKFRVQSLSYTENREHGIVSGSEVSP